MSELDKLQCSEMNNGARCRNWRGHIGGCSWTEPKYTQAQLDTAVAKARRDALTEAATDLETVADESAYWAKSSDSLAMREHHELCSATMNRALAIVRALIDAPEKEGSDRG